MSQVSATSAGVRALTEHLWRAAVGAQDPVARLASWQGATCLHRGVSTAEECGFAPQLLLCEALSLGSASRALAKMLVEEAVR